MLAVAFRGWREEVQLQLYRRHVVVVLNHKVNNGVLLKAFNCWRCAVFAYWYHSFIVHSFAPDEPAMQQLL